MFSYTVPQTVFAANIATNDRHTPVTLLSDNNNTGHLIQYNTGHLILVTSQDGDPPTMTTDQVMWPIATDVVWLVPTVSPARTAQLIKDSRCGLECTQATTNYTGPQIPQRSSNLGGRGGAMRSCATITVASSVTQCKQVKVKRGGVVGRCYFNNPISTLPLSNGITAGYSTRKNCRRPRSDQPH